MGKGRKMRSQSDFLFVCCSLSKVTYLLDLKKSNKSLQHKLKSSGIKPLSLCPYFLQAAKKKQTLIAFKIE